MSLENDKPAPVHPGEILQEEFLEPMGISQSALAEHTALPLTSIHQVVNASRGISAEIALRLSHYFGNSEAFWMNLQTRYDLEVAKDQLGDRLNQEVYTIQRS